MAQFNVDSAQVAQASAQTATVANQIRTDVATMMAQLETLQSSWTGAASASFADCAQRWRAAQMQMEEALDSISQALAHSASQYEQTESGIVSMFAG